MSPTEWNNPREKRLSGSKVKNCFSMYVWSNFEVWFFINHICGLEIANLTTDNRFRWFIKIMCAKRTKEIHKPNPPESIKVWANLETLSNRNTLATWVDIADFATKNLCFIAVSFPDNAFNSGFRALTIQLCLFYLNPKAYSIWNSGHWEKVNYLDLILDLAWLIGFPESDKAWYIHVIIIFRFWISCSII